MKNLMTTFLQVWIILGLLSTTANANPVGISISGKIIEDSTGLALTGPIAFRVKLMSKDNCILYSEEFTTTLSVTGTFTFTLGKGANSVNAYYPLNPVTGQSMEGMNRLFSNLNSSPVTSLGNGAASGSPISSDNVACPGTYTPVADDFRKVRIEFDNGDSQGYRAILPYHQIRTVPYAMIAEEAGDSEKLGGVAAADYAKLSDLPNLSTDVPAAETDPNVQAFAKAAVSGVSGNSCPAGYILTLDNDALKCVLDGGSGAAYTLPVATDAVLGGVMVPSASKIAVDASGNLTLKALATSDVTGLDTALAGAVKYTDMPGTACGAGEALIWTVPTSFTCASITVDQSHVTNLTTDLAGKVSKSGDTMTGALNMGGQDVLATGHITMSNQKIITIGKFDQTQENAQAGTLGAAHEGSTWYNSAMKALRFWDGSARQTVVSTTAACTDGQVLKWNDTTKVWYCAADAGASGGANATQIQGVDVAATAPTAAGQVLRYDGTSEWVPSMLQAADLPSGIARSKVATGTPDHVLINDGSGNLSSEAHLAVTRGGTGQSTYNDGELLIGNSSGNTLTKSTLTAGTGITITNGNGSIEIAATATAPSDSNYNTKGVVGFDTNAVTSGMVYSSSGIAKVNTGIGADQIVKLDGSAKLPAVDGSALLNLTIPVDQITSDTGKYFTYAPNGIACANDKILKMTVNGWECGDDTGGWTAVDSSYSLKGIVQFDADAATSGMVYSSSGVAKVNTGTGADQIVKLDGSSKLPAVDGSALTHLDVSHIDSAAGKYFTYAPNGSECSAGGVLKWDDTNHRWICGADAGAGGADASSIRSQPVDGVATAGIGNFLQHDGTKWAFVSLPVCTADKVLTFNVNGIATCEDIAGLTNSAIAANAAIARTKLAAGTADRAVITDNNGFMTESTVTATELGYVSGVTSSIQTQIDNISSSGSGKVAKTGDTMTGDLVMNAQKEVRFADSDSDHYVALRSPATVANDVTLTLPTTAGTADYVLKTDGTGQLDWVALPGAATDSNYDTKGVVGFDTNAATSGMVYSSSGIAKVNTGIGADQIVKLDGSAKLPAVDGSALTNLSVSVDKITSGAGKYFTYAPNGVACANDKILKMTASGWACGDDSGASGTADAISIRNVPVSATAATPAAGAFLVYNNVTTSWEATTFTDCVGSGKTINYNVSTNTWNCVDIAVSSAMITDGTIVNADISATAAIARTKLAAGTADRAVITDSNGFMTESAVTSTELGYLSGVTSSIQTQIDNISSSGTGKVSKTGDTMTGDLVMNAQKEVRFADSDSSNYVGFKAPATVGSNIVYTLPDADGSANQVLQTDGAGVLSWATPATGGSDTLGGLSCSSGDVATWDGAAWVCQGTGSTNVASTIVKRSPSGAISAGVSDFTGVRVFDGVSGYITLQTPATVTSYSLTLPTGTGTNGQMLTTNGSGVLSWTSPSASLPGLASAKVWVGNSGGTATAVSMSGDATMDNAGAVTIGANTIGSNHIIDSSIDNADINPSANIARSKIASGVAHGVLVNDGSGVMQNGLACATTGDVLTWTGASTGFACQTPSAALPSLASGKFWMGNASSVATAVSMGGDATMSSSGIISIGTNKILSSHIMDGTLKNEDISTSAAIARSKVASGNNYAIVTNNGSGVMGDGLACTTVGEVLTWVGGTTGFACQTPAGGGSLPTLASGNIWVGNSSSVATAAAPSGDVSMTNAGAFTVTKLQSRSVSSTTPTANQVLMYISNTWTPTSPTTSGAVSSLLQLDASGIATALGVAVKGASTGAVTLKAPNSFTNYNLTLPADDGDANQVLTTNGSGTLTWTTPGGAPTITAKTADFTVATGEDNYFYMISNATSATLPAVASVPAGFRATFKRMGGGNVNVIASGSETIDGATQRSLTSVYQSITVMNTGSEWAVIGGGATGTLSGCVPGSQSFTGLGAATLSIDADRASKCKFTITVKGAGGGSGDGAVGGAGGGVSMVYTAPGAGSFQIYVGGGGGLKTGGAGGGGAGAGGTSLGGGGGGASAVRFTTSAPTDVLLAIAGGGGGGSSGGASGTGGTGGGENPATPGGALSGLHFGGAGANNVGGVGGSVTNTGGAGGSNSGNGTAGTGSGLGAGGTAVSAFSISGGGGAGGASSGGGGGGAGYGGGGGGSSSSGGGGGGGGYVNTGSIDSHTSISGAAAGQNGSVLIEWN